MGAVRFGRYKSHFSTQEHEGMDAWRHGQVPLKAPLLIDLKGEPFEMAPVDSSHYDEWQLRRMYAFGPVGGIVAEFTATFEEFPQRQEAGSFTPKQ